MYVCDRKNFVGIWFVLEHMLDDTRTLDIIVVIWIVSDKMWLCSLVKQHVISRIQGNNYAVRLFSMLYSIWWMGLF